MEPSAVELDDLVARFAACRIPRPEWTHAAHLAVGLWHVAHFGAATALERLRVGICKLNESNGVPNSDTDGYHESITRAYVALLEQFLNTFPPQVPLSERYSELCRSRLARRGALLSFYTRETLLSVRARREWVEPDAAPLLLAQLR